METEGTEGATASKEAMPARVGTGMETEGTRTADRLARPCEADLTKKAVILPLVESLEVEAAGVLLPALSMVGLMVEAADVLLPAPSMVGLMVSSMTAAPVPNFCACGATTGRVVEEELLASRALHTHAPAHSLQALTHAAASWPAAPPAPAGASGLICDRLFMSSRLMLGSKPAGLQGRVASRMLAEVRDTMSDLGCW